MSVFVMSMWVCGMCCVCISILWKMCTCGVYSVWCVCIQYVLCVCKVCGVSDVFGCVKIMCVYMFIWYMGCGCEWCTYIQILVHT